MAKFKVLAIKPVLCQRIGIIATSIITPPHRFFRSFADFYVWFILFTFLVSSLLFVLTNYEDINPTLKTIPMIIGGFQSLGMFMGVGFRSQKITALREKLQTLVDNVDENSNVFKNYWKREQSCRKFTERLSRYVHAEQAIYLPVFLRSLFLLFTGDFDASKLILPYNLLLPWDTETVFGWYVYWFYSASIAFCFSSAMIPVTTFFVSCSFYIKALCEHIGLLAETINEHVESHRTEASSFKQVMVLKKMQQTYTEMVNIHIELGEITDLIASIFSGSIFALLPPMALFLAMEMYTMENCEFDAVSIGFAVICVFVGTLWSSLFSIHSSRAIDQIEGVGETVYNTNWYDLPPAIQKYTVLIIVRSQVDVNFTGLGMIYCNLETFGKLGNSSVSYYLVFRELSKMG